MFAADRFEDRFATRERERDGEREYRNRISVWVRVKGERKTLGTGEVDREGWKKKGG